MRVRMPYRYAVLGWLAAIALVMGASVVPAAAEGQTDLLHFERRVDADYPDVASLVPHEVVRMMRQRSDIVFLDVREQVEFEVSHLPGAIRVDPGLSADKFATAFGSLVAGRTVVLYCSVGVRSSRLAQRIAARAHTRGATGIYNLRGGIFAWHNYGLDLASGGGRTEFVHPYSRSWSRYLDFPEYARYRSP